MARIVRHNDESVREGYIRNDGKEVKLFTSALKDFQCNNRIDMAQRKHLDDFLRGRFIGRLECGRTQLEISEELGIAQSVISRLWQRFQDDECNDDRSHLSGCYSGTTCMFVSGAMGAEFLFMDDNARPHRANIVDECLQSEDIPRMDWPAYSPDLKPIENV
ncbi:uncharacterized protein TNCV_2625391 [Trichonephila clavipes]|nr:uncharacterized protein TNCV_2625391 [Trichonephila clavipes]